MNGIMAEEKALNIEEEKMVEEAFQQAQEES